MVKREMANSCALTAPLRGSTCSSQNSGACAVQGRLTAAATFLSRRGSRALAVDFRLSRSRGQMSGCPAGSVQLLRAQVH